MKIYGTFKNQDNEAVTVTIVSSVSGSDIEIGSTKDDGGNTEIYFTDDPIQIETECEDSFSTIIKKSLTLNLWVTRYLGGYLFAGSTKDVSITVSKGGSVIFDGYVTPNSYSQPYADLYDTLNLNCVDRLSLLENEYLAKTSDEYDTLKAASTTVSFKSILNAILGSGKTIYYDGSKLLGSSNAFTSIGVSENLFYGDEYDDLMSNEEILEAILTYLNLHIIQEGSLFYIFDWQSVKNGSISWTDLNSSSTKTNGSLVTVTKDMYASDDTTTSIADVYNQIIVTDDIVDIEDVIQSPFDDDSIKTLWRGKRRYMTEIDCGGEGSTSNSAFRDLIENDHDNGYDGTYAKDYFVKLVNNTNWQFNTFKNGTFQNIYETSDMSSLSFFDNVTKYTPFLCQVGNVDHESNTRSSNEYDAPTSLDTYIVIPLRGGGSNTEQTFSEIGTTLQTMYTAAKAQDSGLMVYNGNTSVAYGQSGGANSKNYFVFSGEIFLTPFLELSTKGTALSSTWWNTVAYDRNTTDGSGNGRYTIWFYGDDDKPITDSSTDSGFKTSRLRITDIDTAFKQDRFKYDRNADASTDDLIGKVGILQCTLQVGDRYCVEYCDYTTDDDGNRVWGYDATYVWMTESEWNTAIASQPTSTSGTAIVEESCPSFSLGFDPNIDDFILGDKYDISNNITSQMNLGDSKGTAIEIPSDLEGRIKFRVIGLVNSEFKKTYYRHSTLFRHSKTHTDSYNILDNIDTIIISDFECKVVSDNSGIENDYDGDVVYYSDETTDYLSRKDDIEFKINTLLSADESFESEMSAPTINISSAINVSTKQAVGNIYSKVDDISAYAEKLYINQYWNEFNKPRLIVQSTLKDLDASPFNTYKIGYLGKTFYPMAISQNLKQNTYTMTLKEI